MGTKKGRRAGGLAVGAAFGIAAAAALALAGDDPVTVPAPRTPMAEGEKALAAAALSRTIDREVDRRLQAEGVVPVGPSDDAEFLRRVTLDVLGVPPTEEEVRAFLASKDPGKREAKVGALLADPLYGERQAEIWSRLLFAELRRYRGPERESVRRWLVDSFNSGRGLDALAREVLTATGNTRENPALAFTLRFRDGGIPADIAGTTSRLFLGVQIQCCQCHDHPYESWKMGDFAGMAAFFNLVQPRPADPMDPRQGFVVEDPDPRRLARSRERGGVGPDIRGAAGADPAFLGGPVYADRPGATRRGALADWIVSRDNPWFARAQVNRAWSWFFGRGLVAPVDDFRPGNPASHPELLESLALGFAEAGYDLRFLARAIALSRAYQRTSRLPAKGGPADEAALRAYDRLYARGPVKPLTADQVFDSVLRVTGMDDAFRRANRAELDRVKEGLLRQFVSAIDDDETGDSEQWAGTIPQGLLLMNGPLTQMGTRAGAPSGRGDRIGIAARGNALHAILDGEKDAASRVDRLYLTVLGRHPTEEEAAEAAAFGSRGKSGQGWEDLAWALLNSSEFMSNH
jgi:hypothetical protein